MCARVWVKEFFTAGCSSFLSNLRIIIFIIAAGYSSLPCRWDKGNGNEVLNIMPCDKCKNEEENFRNWTFTSRHTLYIVSVILCKLALDCQQSESLSGPIKCKYLSYETVRFHIYWGKGEEL